GIATGTALLRMANNKHWVNDVLAGAGIGILSAKVGMWLLPWERRLLGWDKNKKGNLAVVPFYEPTTKGFGGALAITL
ncbi:MAG: phosphatase PAP2 family protein, partial [Bacteroidaceae bacterium]|nr:phosphatase PAP2 family protein [Bacteroidaceae bacterium]